MHLSGIFIYPVKSMGGISLRESVVEEAGLCHDRRWMLLDEQGSFLTQRQVPAMALFQMQLGGHGILVSYPQENAGSIEIPFGLPDTAVETVRVWNDEVAAQAVAGYIDEWFSDCLKKRCRLVRIGEQASRRSLVGKGDKVVSFADSQPVLIIGENSLNDLNSRLPEPVPMNRFRPNFVFHGGYPFEEEQWSAFTLGDVFFKNIKPCERCVLTTIDQEQGKKAGKEPLRTLSTYRKRGDAVCFGMLAAPARVSAGSVVALHCLVEPVA